MLFYIWIDILNIKIGKSLIAIADSCDLYRVITICLTLVLFIVTLSSWVSFAMFLFYLNPNFKSNLRYPDRFSCNVEIYLLKPTKSREKMIEYQLDISKYRPVALFRNTFIHYYYTIDRRAVGMWMYIRMLTTVDK